MKIYKKYGDDSIDTVRQQPYRLAADIWGIVYLPPFYHSERSLAAALRRLSSTGADRLKAFQAVDWDKALGWLKARTGADLAPEQAEAVKLALTRKVAVLTGGPRLRQELHRPRTTDSIPGAFTLGRWAWPVIGFVLAYTVLIMIVLSFPAPFHGSDKMLGYALALAALWCFGGLLWRLRKGTAGVKPVSDLVDKR